jgi:hypothetical protein
MVDKSFFKDEEAFEKFAKLKKEEKEKILLKSCPGFYPAVDKGTEEVDQILDEVKEKATANKKKKEKDACKEKKNSQAKL